MTAKLSKLLTLLLIAAVFSACLKIDEPEPEDPEPQMKQLLIESQYYLSESFASDFARIPLVWMQQISGVRGYHMQVELYDVQTGRFNVAWSQYYLNLMQRLYLLDYIATESDSPFYLGIAKVLQAFAAGVASDAWGDMPYTETQRYYSVVQTPKYDTQESIYTALINILDEGISLLEEHSNHPVKPGEGVDMFYAGSAAQWIRMAHLVRLRLSLRLAHRADNYDVPLQLIQQGGMFSSAADDMAFPYALFDGLLNPWYSFDYDIGDIRSSEKMIGLLTSTNDPRLPRYFRINTNNEYLGSVPGTPNLNASRLANAQLSIAWQARSLVLLSYTEQKFIEAEVYYRHGMQQQADEAFSQAVTASLDMHSARNETWEAANARVNDVNLETIMTAKYIALFLNPEVWTDWRRTAYPDLVPPLNNVNEDLVPRRFLYPESEHLQNQSNTPQGITLNTHVWWDRE